MTETGEQSSSAKENLFSKAMRRSLEVSWLMLKIYIPVSLVTVALKQLGVIDAAAPLFAPLMRLMGLPGEAALTVAVGFSNSIYAAIATMSAFDLTARQVTILGVVLGLAHSLFVETAILSKLGMANIRIAFFRMAAAFIAGALMNIAMPRQISGIVTHRKAASAAFSWLQTLQNLALTSLQIVVIITSLMVLFELAARWRHSGAVKERLKFLPNAAGMSTRAFAPWIVGFFIGITYGAAILFQFVQDRRLSHKDACLITVFLCLAHAIIEDTLIFVIVGGNLWWIFLTRVVAAVLVVRGLSAGDLYKSLLWIGLEKESPGRSI